MYYPTEVFQVQSEVQLLSYHGHMNVYPKMNPDIGRYLVFHIEFYQLISGMKDCDNSKKVDKRLELFDAISHDEMAISSRPDSLFFQSRMIFLLMLMDIYRAVWWFAVVIIPVMSSASQLSCWNVFFKSPISSIQWGFFIACNAQVDTTCCAS